MEKNKQYCTNKNLLAELVKFKENGNISNELGKMFMDIAIKLTGHSYFRNYAYHTKEDLVGYALEKMVKSVENYNLEKTKPFAYFTQVAFNAFLYQCKGYYKQINIKRKIAENYFSKIQSEHMININGVITEHLKEMIG